MHDSVMVYPDMVSLGFCGGVPAGSSVIAIYASEACCIYSWLTGRT